MWIEEQDDEQSQNQQTGMQPTTIGSGGTAPSVKSSETPATGTMSSTASTAPQTKQRFGTVQDYFKANQAQGEQLGQKITSNLDETKQQAQQQIGEAAQSTAQQIGAGQIGYDQDLISRTVQDPTKTVANQDDYNKFMQQWNAAYKGPQSFESSADYEKATKAAQEAQMKGEQVKTAGGRQQLLQDKFNVYGQGNKSLDEALLQQSSYFPTVGEKAKELTSIQDYLKGKSAELGTQAQQAAEATQQTKEQTRAAFANTPSKFAEDLDARTKAAQEKAAAEANIYSSALKSGKAEDVQKALEQAGVDKANIANIVDYLQAINTGYNLTPDLAKAYNYNPATAVTRANVATPEDYKRAEALRALTGTDLSGVLGQTTAAQAGTTADPKSGLNAGLLEQRIRDYFAQQNLEDIKLKSPGVTAVELPSMEVPKNVSAATNKALTEIFNKPVSGAGTYGEGKVFDLNNRLETLAGLYRDGKITEQQYKTMAKPLAVKTHQIYNAIAQGGRKSAESVNNYFNIHQFMQKFGNELIN